MVLMLATPHGRVNGPAFIAGWIFGTRRRPEARDGCRLRQ
jgi:hypothetical protein